MYFWTQSGTYSYDENTQYHEFGLQLGYTDEGGVRCFEWSNIIFDKMYFHILLYLIQKPSILKNFNVH